MFRVFYANLQICKGQWRIQRGEEGTFAPPKKKREKERERESVV
jgi:hypothetical protein